MWFVVQFQGDLPPEDEDMEEDYDGPLPDSSPPEREPREASEEEKRPAGLVLTELRVPPNIPEDIRDKVDDEDELHFKEDQRSFLALAPQIAMGSYKGQSGIQLGERLNFEVLEKDGQPALETPVISRGVTVLMSPPRTDKTAAMGTVCMLNQEKVRRSLVGCFALTLSLKLTVRSCVCQQLRPTVVLVAVQKTSVAEDVHASIAKLFDNFKYPLSEDSSYPTMKREVTFLNGVEAKWVKFSEDRVAVRDFKTGSNVLVTTLLVGSLRRLNKFLQEEGIYEILLIVDEADSFLTNPVPRTGSKMVNARTQELFTLCGFPLGERLNSRCFSIVLVPRLCNLLSLTVPPVSNHDTIMRAGQRHCAPSGVVAGADAEKKCARSHCGSGTDTAAVCRFGGLCAGAGWLFGAGLSGL